MSRGPLYKDVHVDRKLIICVLTCPVHMNDGLGLPGLYSRMLGWATYIRGGWAGYPGVWLWGWFMACGRELPQPHLPHGMARRPLCPRVASHQ